MIGTRLSHFLLKAKLGEGGMGEVYEAWDESLERAVALKVLPPEMVRSPDRVRRFVQEAKSASALSHPHIVTIHEIGEAELEGGEKTHFIAMELIDGHTLKTKIHRDQVGPTDLLRWLSQAAEGLAKAHSEGIVHRDLKPDNIMITSDGYTKVLDFGLAKLTEPLGEGTRAPTQIADETAEGAVMGTVGYMSPEQVQAKKVDHRTDIFSLGCVLFEAMTRQRPFAGETAVDTMHQILRANPPSVRELSPATPSAVQRVIRRCLAKDPERRFQSMKDLALELDDLVEEWDELKAETDSATWSQSGSLAPVLAPKGRWGLWLGLAAVALTALGALLLTLRAFDSKTADDGAPAPRASFDQITQQAGSEYHGDLSPDGKFVAYVSRATGRDDIYLLRVGGRNPLNLTADSGADHRAPAFSPDGEQIAFQSAQDGGGLFVMGATGESVRRLTDFGSDPAWSPDGEQIAFSTESTNDPAARAAKGELWVAAAAGGEPRMIYEGDAMRPRWSSSGRRIVFWAIKDFDLGGGQRDIGSIGIEDDAPVWLTDDKHLDWSPVWSPDGDFVYFLSDRGGSMNLWRLGVDEADGTPIGDPQPVTVPSRSIGWLSISAAGDRLLYTDASSSSNLERVEFDAGALEVVGPPTPVTRGTALYIQPSVSPDGSWIAFRSAGRQEDLYLVRYDGSDLRKLTDDAPKDRRPVWFPGGEKLAFYSDRTGRYEAWSIGLDGSGLEQLTASSGDPFYYPRISPDGRWMVATQEKATALWELVGPLPLSEHQTLPPIDAAGRFMFDPEWSPDGTRLAGLLWAPDANGAQGIVTFSLEDQQYDIVYTPAEGRVVGTPIWLGDGKQLLFGWISDGGERALRALDLVGGSTREVWKIPDQTSNFTLSPDQRALVFVQESGESDLWLATLD